MRIAAALAIAAAAAGGTLFAGLLEDPSY